MATSFATLTAEEKEKFAPRREFDFYPTPLWACREALNKLTDIVPDDIKSILDPGAGGGEWGKAARELWGDAEIQGVDIRTTDKPAEYDGWAVTDFLTYTNRPFDLIIGNPPYNMAEQFVRHSMSLLRDEGVLVFLLRLAFLEGQARAKSLYQDYPPYRVFTYAARPSFMPEGSDKFGKTDATAYCAMIWVKGLKTSFYQGGWIQKPDYAKRKAA